jgi:hypothetical protein
LIDEYDLGVSSKSLGKLYPILKDKAGNVIDGFHRQNADPEWPCVTVESVDTPVKLELARLAVNFCRRTVEKTEFDNGIAFLIKNGLKVEEIAQQTGIGTATIYRHMPQELKDDKISKTTSEAMKKVSEVSRQSLSPDRSFSTIQDIVSCDRCHVSTSTPVEWHNHQLCEQCHNKALLNPETFNSYFGYQSKNPEPKVALTTNTIRPLEKWEDRKAHMSPQHSKMEGIVIASLIESGVTGIIQDRHFCVQETIPDIYLPAQNLAIYLDGEAVHNGKQDRDEQLRDLLKRRHGVNFLSFSYDSTSQKEVDRVTKEILAVVKVEASQ